MKLYRKNSDLAHTYTYSMSCSTFIKHYGITMSSKQDTSKLLEHIITVVCLKIVKCALETLTEPWYNNLLSFSHLRQSNLFHLHFSVHCFCLFNVFPSLTNFLSQSRLNTFLNDFRFCIPCTMCLLFNSCHPMM